MDVMGGSLQEEQSFCFGAYLPREIAASTSILLVALKDVSSAHPFQLYTKNNNGKTQDAVTHMWQPPVPTQSTTTISQILVRSRVPLDQKEVTYLLLAASFYLLVSRCRVLPADLGWSLAVVC